MVLVTHLPGGDAQVPANSHVEPPQVVTPVAAALTFPVSPLDSVAPLSPSTVAEAITSAVPPSLSMSGDYAPPSGGRVPVLAATISADPALSASDAPPSSSLSLPDPPEPSEPLGGEQTLDRPEMDCSQESTALNRFTLPAVPSAGCARLEWLDADIWVRDISADGTTLIGNTGPVDTPQYSDPIPAGPAFRWVRGRAIEALGEQRRANAVNDDGSWVVGAELDGLSATTALIWDPTGREWRLIGRGEQSEAFAVSPDGCTVLGSDVEQSGAFEVGFRWTAGAGVHRWPADTTSTASWYPIDISADGHVGLGFGLPGAPGASYTLRLWVDNQDPRMLDAGHPFALSRDGRFAVGDDAGVYSTSRSRRWSIETGDWIQLGFSEPQDGTAQLARGTVVSSDGSVVFGIGGVKDPALAELSDYEGYIWREGFEVQTLIEFLQAGCVDTTEFPIAPWRVMAMSADARVLVGCATLPGSTGACWIAEWD